MFYRCSGWLWGLSTQLSKHCWNPGARGRDRRLKLSKTSFLSHQYCTFQPNCMSLQNNKMSISIFNITLSYLTQISPMCLIMIRNILIPLLYPLYETHKHIQIHIQLWKHILLCHYECDYSHQLILLGVLSDLKHIKLKLLNFAQLSPCVPLNSQ
jgi:hypothetical protein